MPLIECVPNISEGQREHVIADLTRAVMVPGAHFLDRSSDPSHNRTVFTLAGEPDPLQLAVANLFSTAIGHIDLRNHSGAHPRVGAVDVVPFVPLQGATIVQCVELAKSTGALIADRFELPVFLYEDAASSPHRRNLAEIRKGGLDQLTIRMQRETDRWTPDFGPCRPHPSAGVVAIGARQILIAFNVNLASTDVDVARRIARSIRESNGGFAAIKAIGLGLEHRHIAQVSMNLTDFTRTSLVAVFDEIERQAAARGIAVLESEIVGLVPERALPSGAKARLKLQMDPATIEERLARAVAAG
jgi:glutamate formiminotransferase